MRWARGAVGARFERHCTMLYKTQHKTPTPELVSKPPSPPQRTLCSPLTRVPPSPSTPSPSPAPRQPPGPALPLLLRSFVVTHLYLRLNPQDLGGVRSFKGAGPTPAIFTAQFFFKRQNKLRAVNERSPLPLFSSTWWCDGLPPRCQPSVASGAKERVGWYYTLFRVFPSSTFEQREPRARERERPLRSGVAG